MRLYLMRHAEAVPRGTLEYAIDAQRPLTTEGQAQARQTAEGLKRLKVPVALIASSPYVRAMQTAQRVARVFGEQVQIVEVDALRGEARPSDASKALGQLSTMAHLLCVGHEPHLSTWLAELVAGPGGIQMQFKKAGVACVELEQVPPPRGSGTLRWLLTPKQLALIGKSA
jgi:phosphohistidine phosphatase